MKRTKKQCMRNLIPILRIAGALISLFVFQKVSAQNTIKGVIKDPAEKPVVYANVLLLKAADSSLVKGTITDASGKYVFENVKSGSYYIMASFTGMEPTGTKTIEINTNATGTDLGILYLRNANTTLENVTVTGKKPLFEQKIDRTIINVKNSITSAGGTALDVLEKSPGVTVSRQSNSIAINGKNGVNVMINGKITYMPAEAMIQLLAGTNAGNIERIELITAPPSKYDAAGNGGYINIVLINNPYSGFNGSYFLTAGYGNKELVGSAGANFNYRSARVNLYGSYSYNRNHYIQPIRALTQFTRAGNTITNASYSDRDAITDIQNARIGIDYQLDTATVIGALVSGYISKWSMIARNGATISKNNVPDTIITTVNDPEMNLWHHVLANINFQHSFRPGKTIFFDVNYIYYKDDNPNNYSTDYYSGAKEFLFHEDARGTKITPIHFYVFSSDYTTPLGKNVSMDAGAKLTLSKFTNDVRVENFKQGTWVPVDDLTAKYLLKENISALYTSFNINTGNKVSVKAGFRYEYTTSNLGTTETSNIVDRKYGELFPSVAVSKKLNDNNAINVSYSRRITRPSFNDLAPFTIFFDPKTFYSGNAALQPAIANTIQAGYVYKNYSLSIGYTREVNSIDNWYFQTRELDTIQNILYLSPRNFKSQQYLTAGFSLPFTIAAWWSMQNNINGNWRQVHTEHSNIPVLLQNFDFSINSTQRFTLAKDVTAEITGFYSSATYVGTSRRKPAYQLDAGLQKKFTNGKDILRLAATDIFNSAAYYNFKEVLPTGAIVNRTFNYGLVACKFTYTHNFGNTALKGKRERSTGAEDELKRVHN